MGVWLNRLQNKGFPYLPSLARVKVKKLRECLKKRQEGDKEPKMESHEQRSLAGYSPWGHKELDPTEQLSTHTKHTYIKLTVLASCQCLVQGHGTRSRHCQPPPSHISGTSSPARTAPVRQRPSPLADPGSRQPPFSPRSL